jgi:peptide deformylase
MAVRPTVVWPDERLRQPTTKIDAIDASVRELYQDLVDSMYADNGVGMAAPQIGVTRKMFIVDGKLANRADGQCIAFINPEVVWTSDEQQDSEEGCLSFPDIYVKIKRPMRARLRAMGLDGELFELEGEGLLARCMLHENDHLTGKLMIDFVGPLKRQMIKKKMSRYKSTAAEV